MKLKKKDLFYFALLFPFIKPGVFEYIGLIDNIYNILRLLSFTYLTFNLFYKQKLTLLEVYVIVMQIISLIGTLIGGASVIRWIMTTAINISAIIIISEWGHRSFHSMIAYFGKYLNLLVIINFVLLYVFPNGLVNTPAGRCNFLDIDNLMAPVLFVSILLNGFAIYYKVYSKKYSVLCIIVACITPFITMCATSLIAVAVAILFWFGGLGLRSKRKIFNAKTLFIIFLGIFLLVVCSQSISFLTEFIELYLGKSATLSGRTYIWQDFFRYIKSSDFNLILGTGVRDSYYFYSSSFGQDVHPHNQLLFIVLENGLVGTLGWCGLNLLAGSNLKGDSKIVLWIEVIYFAFLIAMIGEVFRNNFYFYTILTLMHMFNTKHKKQYFDKKLLF